MAASIPAWSSLGLKRLDERNGGINRSFVVGNGGVEFREVGHNEFLVFEDVDAQVSPSLTVETGCGYLLRTLDVNTECLRVN